MTVCDPIRSTRQARVVRVGEGMQAFSTLLLTMCVLGRVFLGEVCYRLPVLSVADALAKQGQLNLDDLTRVAFSLLMLSAGVLWFFGGALTGKLTLRRLGLGGLVVAFSATVCLGRAGAGDKLSAGIVWIEQTSLLLTAWLAAQMFAEPKRFRLLVAALAAVGVTLAVKGIYQTTVEFPETLAVFHAQRANGGPPTVFDRLMEARLRDAAPTGWFPLANVYASLLIVLMASAIGVLVDRVAAARRALRDAGPSRQPAEIPMPAVQAGVAAIVAALCGVALAMTRSTGAIGSAAVAAVIAVIVVGFRGRLARHWRKAVMAAGIAALLVGGMTVAYGMKHDRLPTKTMTFRWYYWTASAKIVRERPLLGVGGGNFADPYLRHRRAEAEESVKTPHNVLIHAVTQFGLIGGGMYVLVLVCALVGMCRPRHDGQQQTDPPPSTCLAVWPAALLGLMVLAVRVLFSPAHYNWAVLLLDAIIPASLTAAAMLLLSWGWQRGAVSASASRIALGCGLAGFALHSMVSSSIWMPGAAGVFWLGIGAMLAQADTRPPRVFRWMATLPTNVLIIVVIGIAFGTGSSILRNIAPWRDVRNAIGRDDWQAVEDHLLTTVATGIYCVDGPSLAESAKLHRHLQHRAGRPASLMHVALKSSALMAKLATIAQSEHSSFHALSARILHEMAKAEPQTYAPRAAEAMSRAVDLDPMNAPLRIECAEILLLAQRYDEALHQAQMAETIDNRLPADSLFRLSQSQRKHLARLMRHAEAAAPLP
jgi:O-antigen ligase